MKPVKKCRIDTGPCEKALSKIHPPKTLGTRVSSEMGTARIYSWAKGLVDHRFVHEPVVCDLMITSCVSVRCT